VVLFLVSFIGCFRLDIPLPMMATPMGLLMSGAMLEWLRSYALPLSFRRLALYACEVYEILFFLICFQFVSKHIWVSFGPSRFLD
jgi:hypothetical protein